MSHFELHEEHATVNTFGLVHHGWKAMALSTELSVRDPSPTGSVYTVLIGSGLVNGRISHLQ